MARFLSDEWIAELDELARKAEPVDNDRRGSLRIRQVVTGEQAASYVVTVKHGKLRAARDDAPADVTITEDYATARDLAQGILTPEEALAHGRIRVSGDVGELVRAADVLVRLRSVAAAIAPVTTW